uniref:Putative salivary secreted protein n=1 Tax=Ixodes ricinus TaxID=34613 RepID=A0A6B0UUQ2_IXORI
MRKIDLAILIVQLAAGACVSREHSSSLYNERMQFQANCSSYFRKKFKDNKGVPTSDPPIPFQCWNHIQNVGAIFCLLTGTDGFSRFDWVFCQLECKNSDFPMGLPFDKLDPDELVTLGFAFYFKRRPGALILALAKVARNPGTQTEK